MNGATTSFTTAAVTTAAAAADTTVFASVVAGAVGAHGAVDSFPCRNETPTAAQMFHGKAHERRHVYYTCFTVVEATM